MQRVFVGSVFLTAIVLVFVLCWAGPSAGEPLSVENLQKPATPQQIPEITDALGKLNKGDVDGALADIKAAVAKHKQLPPAEVIMAEISSRTNQGGTVRFWLERAVAEAPNDPEAYARLGDAALQNRQLAEARLLFEKAYQLLAKFDGDAKRKENIQSMTCRQLAGLALGRKEWDTAKGYLDELLKVRPDDAKALQMLARVLFEQGKIDEALEKLTAAKKADIEMLTPEAILAQWFEDAKDHAKAEQYMIAALNRDKRNFNTRFVAANWKFQTQDFDQARKQADLALQLAKDQGGDTSRALMLAGNIAFYQGDYPAAEKYLREAVAAAPAVFGASNNLALVLCEQDDEAKKRLALDYARINAVLYPKEIEALSTLGRVLYRLGDLKEADNVFRKLLTSGQPLSTDTVYYVAVLYAQTDRKEDAKRFLTEAVKKEGLFSQRANAEKLLKELGP